MILGINQSNLTQLSAADLDRVCGDIAAFGFTHVRFSAHWGQAAGFMGLGLFPTDYSKFTAVSAALTKHGLTGLPVVGIGKPTFNNGPSQFATFVKGVLAKFPGIQAVEVWNEPNLWNFMVGGPAAYLPYLRAAAPVIRAAGAQVIHAGLAALPNSGSGNARTWAASDFLAGLYAAGESDDYDILGYHPYPLTASGWADPATNPFGMAQIAVMDAITVQHGDRPTYAFTEVGYDTSQVPVAVAGDQLTYQLGQLPADAPVWLFCWRDTDNDGGKYGLVDKNNQPKQPYFDAVKGLIVNGLPD